MRETREKTMNSLPQSRIVKNARGKKYEKIGEPGYKVVKQQDPETGQKSLLFDVDYPEFMVSELLK